MKMPSYLHLYRQAKLYHRLTTQRWYRVIDFYQLLTIPLLTLLILACLPLTIYHLVIGPINSSFYLTILAIYIALTFSTLLAWILLPNSEMWRLPNEIETQRLLSIHAEAQEYLNLLVQHGENRALYFGEIQQLEKYFRRIKLTVT